MQGGLWFMCCSLPSCTNPTRYWTPSVPFPPLAPRLPQFTQTVNEVHKTTRLVSAIVDIQQCTPSKVYNNVKHTGSLTATCSPLKNSPLNCHLISGLCEPKTSRNNMQQELKHADKMNKIKIYRSLKIVVQMLHSACLMRWLNAEFCLFL